MMMPRGPKFRPLENIWQIHRSCTQSLQLETQAEKLGRWAVRPSGVEEHWGLTSRTTGWGPKSCWLGKDCWPTPYPSIIPLCFSLRNGKPCGFAGLKKTCLLALSYLLGGTPGMGYPGPHPWGAKTLTIHLTVH